MDFPDGSIIRWPHAPPHFLVGAGTYMVTARTYFKAHHFDSRKRLRHLTELLLATASENGWALEAWAVMANHYHWIGKAPGEGVGRLGKWIGKVHSASAQFVNNLDQTPGRKVWHNYRDSHLTFEKSYLARMNYVMNNPVKHGLVQVAEQYPWCSAAWFAKVADPAFHRVVRSFKTDRLRMDDED